MPRKWVSPRALRIQRQQLNEQVKRGVLPYEKAVKKLSGLVQREGK